MLDMLSRHWDWYIKKKLCLVHSKFPTTIETMIAVCFLSLLFEKTQHHATEFIRGRRLLIFLL